LTAKIDEMMGLMLEDADVWVWQLRRSRVKWENRSEFYGAWPSIDKDGDMSQGH